MAGPRTREANQARLVRCSAGCRTLVWLAGALPTTADAAYVCAQCSKLERNGACESCGATADVVLPDGSRWCGACHGSALRLGLDDEVGTSLNVEALLDCGHECCGHRSAPGHQHLDTPAACPDCDRLRGLAGVANDLIARMAAAQLAQLDEPVDVVRAALLADVEPMSWTGMAMFILDALDAAGFEVKKSERSRAVGAPPTSPSDALAWRVPADANHPGAGRTSTGPEPARTDSVPLSSGLSCTNEWHSDATYRRVGGAL